MLDNKQIIPIADIDLFNDLSLLIEQSKNQLVSYANSTVTVLFWQVGKRINEHILINMGGRIWEADCADSVGTIGKILWAELY